MTPIEQDRAMATNGTGGSQDPGATTSYSPSAGAATVAGTSAGPTAGTRRFEFLGSPQAEGELGRLAHYRVKGLIGEGAIGLVFLAEDTHLARPVALKVIRPELADGPGARGRFLREAQATAAINHDHIVTIYQVGRHDDVLFLAMEYLRGVTLQGWLDRGRKPSPDLVLKVGREVASGLAAAHQVGLIHRDIKPANLWLEAPSGRVKILDFGMARSERDARITHAGTVMGTPAYMAPEQARGEVAGVGSDLFGLGCVLYRLAAGRLPFEGETILAVLSALASDTPRSLREIDPAVSPALDDLVSRLLAKDPSARPASARAVVDAIRTIERDLAADRQDEKLSDGPDRPAGPAMPGLHAVGIELDPDALRPVPRAGRRPRRIAAIVATAVAVAVTVGVLVVYRLPRGLQEVATREATSASAPSATAVMTDPATEGGTNPATRRTARDLPLPGPAPAPAPTGDPARTADVPARPAPIEMGKVDARVDASGPPAPGRPDALEAKRGGEVAPERPTSATPTGDGWHQPIDPDGDCKFEIDRMIDGIRIAVPGTPHVLSAELGRWNAPRLLRSVRGDFDVSVIVDGVSRPSGKATTKEYAPYHGAGILLWQDERNYVRLEIAADIHRGKPRSYANFELRKGGTLAVSKGLEIKDGSTRLRLERRGSAVRAAFGPDGVRWTRFEPLTVGFDDRLGVGVAAINSAAKPLVAELKGFTITSRGRAGGDGIDGSSIPPRPEARLSP